MSDDTTNSDGVLHHAKRVLRNSPYQEIRNLGCEFNDGVLTLNGVVTTFYLKQLAQSAVQSLEGVDKLQNNTIVRRDDAHQSADPG